MRINTSAGSAARAKNASEAALQIDVASVLKPGGLKINVAGSSFIVNRKTRPEPANIPRNARGRVIRRKDCKEDFPKLREASSSRGLICNKAAWVLPPLAERKSTR